MPDPTRRGLLRALACLPLFTAPACRRADEAGAGTVYRVRGTIRKVKDDGRMAVIDHEEIPGYMEAMAMPFQSRPGSAVFSATKPGDQVEFDYHIGTAEAEAWVDHLEIVGSAR